MVYFESEITAKFSCSLHFMDFPDVQVKIMFTLAVLTYIFVFQVCSIKIESFSYDTENLGLEWHSPGVEFANIIEIPQFKLEGKKNILPCFLYIVGNKHFYRHAKIYSWK